MVKKNKVWDYGSVGAFFRLYYDKLLTENMITGGELYIEEYKDVDGSPTTCSKFFFPLKKGKFTYLIESKDIKGLPIMVHHYERMSYSGKGYRLADDIEPMRITPEKTMSFRELVNNFANIAHDRPNMDLLWRLVSVVSFVDRINVRVATNPEFGKDSKLNIINSLTGEIGKISNPTIAKLEYLLFNKVCFINEVAGINSQSRQDVEQFLLQCGDFNNEYVKRSRASAGSSEKYDISKMSLVIAYNDLSQYTNTSKYFDFLWTNTGAINNRILPLLFSGKIIEDFNEVFDAEIVARENREFYIKFLRALLYFKGTSITTLKWKQPSFEFGTDRWKRNFLIILRWIDLYAESQEEFDLISKGLFECHLRYNRMIHGDKSERVVEEEPLSVIEESMMASDEQGVLDKLKNGSCNVDDLGVSDELLEKMKKKGDIFEEKPGVVRLLE